MTETDTVSSCSGKAGRLEVVVIGNDHLPLQDAVVEIAIDGKVSRTRTDAEGFAAFEGLKGAPTLRLAMVDASLWKLAASVDLEKTTSDAAPSPLTSPEADANDGGGTYTCLEGDTADAIAAALGVPVTSLKDENGEVVERDVPMLDGASLTFPALTMRRDDAPCGKRHLIARFDIPFRFTVTLRDAIHVDRAGLPYLLKVTMADGSELPHREGVSDEEGRIGEKIPFGAATGELIVDAGGTAEHIKLRFTGLPPVTEVTGLQHRLEKLGFPCGGEDGTLGENTIAALRWFQFAAGLDITGEADDATLDALVARHGW